MMNKCGGPDILMGAGHSIAVQNFNENLSILIMTGVYTLLILADVSINTVIVLFGLLVASVMVLVLFRHRHNQQRHDVESLLNEHRH